jgi:hypothetical protein
MKRRENFDTGPHQPQKQYAGWIFQAPAESRFAEQEERQKLSLSCSAGGDPVGIGWPTPYANRPEGIAA